MLLVLCLERILFLGGLLSDSIDCVAMMPASSCEALGRVEVGWPCSSGVQQRAAAAAPWGVN
eukprot:276647-Pelagomonas_calceolata.AAC.1